MKMAEKLARLTKDKNKSELSRMAGLPSTALSDYVSKGYVPKADTAMKLARALDVPLEWLVDDNANFPVPEVSGKRLKDYPDAELMTEIARRLVLSAMALRVDLEYISGKPWREIAIRLYEGEPGSADPDDQAEVQLFEAYLHRVKNLQRLYDPLRYTDRLPANAGRIEAKQLLEDLQTLNHAVTELRQTHDALMAAMRYRDVVAHAERDPEYFEQERRKALKALSKMDADRIAFKIEGHAVNVLEFKDRHSPPTLRAAKAFDPKRGSENAT